MSGKQGKDSRIKDDRKLIRKEKEWTITGKQGGDGRMKDDRKSRR
jgi:hypothetical protein